MESLGVVAADRRLTITALSGSHFKPPALPVVYDWNSRSILIYIIAKTVSIVKRDRQDVSILP
jgi:hypothetical protein